MDILEGILDNNDAENREEISVKKTDFDPNCSLDLHENDIIEDNQNVVNENTDNSVSMGNEDAVVINDNQTEMGSNDDPTTVNDADIPSPELLKRPRGGHRFLSNYIPI